jgi:hypothetical protein
MSPTDSKLGFGTSVGRAGVRMLVVVVGQIAGENVNQNIKPLCYTSSWRKWKCSAFTQEQLDSFFHLSPKSLWISQHAHFLARCPSLRSLLQ